MGNLVCLALLSWIVGLIPAETAASARVRATASLGVVGIAEAAGRCAVSAVPTTAGRQMVVSGSAAPGAVGTPSSESAVVRPVAALGIASHRAIDRPARPPSVAPARRPPPGGAPVARWAEPSRSVLPSLGDAWFRAVPTPQRPEALAGSHLALPRPPPQ